MANLSDGKLAPLYFAMGSDYFLYRQLVSSLQASFRKQFGGNADLIQRWGADLKTVPDVSSLLESGLFSTASLVILHEIQDAGTAVKTNLAEILKNLPQDTIVLIHYAVADFRKAKWLEAIQAVAQVIAINSPDSSALPRLVSELALKRNLKIDDTGVYRLIELSSSELAIIDNELEKLSIYLDDSTQVIGRDLVDQVAGAVENAQASQFIEAVSKRNRQVAIQTLVEIHHQGKEGLPFLVAMLYNRLIQLMALRETPEARKSIGQGSTSYYFLKNLNSVSNNYTLDELQQATRELSELDLQFRLGHMDTLAAFSAWVSKVV